MKRILVTTFKPIGAHPDVDFDALKQKEMEYIGKWKNSGVLESFYVKSVKDGAVLIFKDLEMAQVVSHVESLPFFPYMAKVEYTHFDKMF